MTDHPYKRNTTKSVTSDLHTAFGSRVLRRNLTIPPISYAFRPVLTSV